MFLSAAPAIVSGASSAQTVQSGERTDVGATSAISSERSLSRVSAENAASSPLSSLLLPALTLFQREIVRFYRMRSRVVGVVASPVLFWFVIGSGFGSSFSGPSG